jgi:hypothetical protein
MNEKRCKLTPAAVSRIAARWCKLAAEVRAEGMTPRRSARALRLMNATQVAATRASASASAAAPTLRGEAHDAMVYVLASVRRDAVACATWWRLGVGRESETK